MYADSVGSINFYVGCSHGCRYCVPSFQAQMKRQRKRCGLCYEYVPHPHLERLSRPPPRTPDGSFIFFPSASDWAFIPADIAEAAYRYMEKWHDRTFLIQTKDPGHLPLVSIPENGIHGTTLETNRSTTEVSKAPSTAARAYTLSCWQARRMVTVEPIMDFDLMEFAAMIVRLEPWRVYVGYDSHPQVNQLPEPPLEKTMALVENLRERGLGLDVRLKSMREKWTP